MRIAPHTHTHTHTHIHEAKEVAPLGGGVEEPHLDTQPLKCSLVPVHMN